MELDTLIKERRSIRKYTDKPVDKALIEEMLNAAILAPSWKNCQSSRYYVVMSKDICSEIRTCLPSFNAERSENATLIVTTFVKGLSGCNPDGSFNNEVGEGWACYDLGLQNQNLMLKAKDLGLDTLVIGIRDSDKIRPILNIPDEEVVVSILAVGYKDENPSMPKRKAIEEISKFF